MTWVVYTDPRDQEVRFLAPERPVVVGSGTAEEQARAFFRTYKEALHASGEDDELELTSSATDASGNVHLRFEHRLPGTDLPVFGTGSTAHFTSDGALYWVIAGFHADLAKVSKAARIGAPDATSAAITLAHDTCGDPVARLQAAKPILGVQAAAGKPSALVYRVPVDASGGTCIAPVVVIDAMSGAALALENGGHSVDTTASGSKYFRANDLDDVKTISVSPGATGTFIMKSEDADGSRVQTVDHKSGTFITTKDLSHWDEMSTGPGCAVDAQFHVRNALRYLRSFAYGYEAHARSSAMPLALDVTARVHYGNNVYNAYGGHDQKTNTDFVFVGDGRSATSATSSPMSAAYDLMAHEVTHILTAHTSRLKYENESGALNESFSDVMAAAAEHAAAPDDARNLLIGEDMFTRTDLAAQPLRSLDDPQLQGQPDHDSGFRACVAGQSPDDKNDFCYVHTNSGIPNRAFSLVVQGGSVPDLSATAPPGGFRPIGVPTGIGWERATEITYWATTGLYDDASFAVAALAQSFEALRSGPEANRAFVCAWRAVGILGRIPVDPFFWVDSARDCKPGLSPLTPPPAPPAPPTVGGFCAGRPDGLVCDPTEVFGAVACKDGKEDIAASRTCSDRDLRCKPVSADDPTAVVDAAGILVCE